MVDYKEGSSGRRYYSQALATRRSPGASASVALRGSSHQKPFVLGNLKAALSEEPRPGAKRKLSGMEEAYWWQPPPQFLRHAPPRWTLELLAGAIVNPTLHTEPVARRCGDAWPRTIVSVAPRPF